MKLLAMAVGLTALVNAVEVQTESYEPLFTDFEALTSADFDAKVAQDAENFWIVTFYADWCPYCKPFSLELTNAKMSDKLYNSKVKFGVVNVMDNRDLTSQYGVKRTPTVKVFGTDKANPEDYAGRRKASDLVDFIVKYATDNNFIDESIEAPVPAVAQYDYNIKKILQQVIDANQKRVSELETSHQ